MVIGHTGFAPDVTVSAAEHPPRAPGGLRRAHPEAISPLDEPRLEAADALAQALMARGITTVVAGFGGDEVARVRRPDGGPVRTPEAPTWRGQRVRDLLCEVNTGILEPPRKSEKPLGFSNAALTDASRKKNAAVIRQIDGAALPGLGGAAQDDTEEETPTEPETPGSTNGKRVKVTCSCEPEPRASPVTPKILAEGPIICGLCEQLFTLPDEEDQDADVGTESGAEAAPDSPTVEPGAVLPGPRPAEADELGGSPMCMGEPPSSSAREARGGSGRRRKSLVVTGPRCHAQGVALGPRAVRGRFRGGWGGLFRLDGLEHVELRGPAGWP